MTRKAGILLLLAAAAALAGCGGGDETQTSAPIVTPNIPTTATTQTATQPKKKKKTKTTTTADKTNNTPEAVASEQACGTVYFPDYGSNVRVTARALPCPTAKAYAKKFISHTPPSQKYLPQGWKLSECSGIAGSQDTPTESNSPRCRHGEQAFTVRIPQG
jgi:hypothetical protein